MLDDIGASFVHRHPDGVGRPLIQAGPSRGLTDELTDFGQISKISRNGELAILRIHTFNPTIDPTKNNRHPSRKAIEDGQEMNNNEL